MTFICNVSNYSFKILIFFRSGELYTEAAEAAMSAMNGRLANRWFMLAEEVWAECEEDEE